LYIGAFDGLNTGDSPAEQSILYLGAEPLAFVPPRKACAIITDHLFRVCGTVLALVAGMRVPPALHLDISAAEIVRVALKPGGLGLALLLFAAAGFAAGFLGFDGTDVRNILAAAIRAAFRGGTFYGDLLHETLSKRVYIEMYWKGMANWGICAADLYTICRQELYTLKLPLTITRLFDFYYRMRHQFRGRVRNWRLPAGEPPCTAKGDMPLLLSAFTVICRKGR